MADRIFVQSLNPPDAYPVRVSYRFDTGVGTGAIQHMLVTDRDADIGLSVVSLAGLGTLPVTVRGANGAVISTFGAGSVTAFQGGTWVVDQGNAPWTVLQAGSWTVNANVLGTVPVAQTGAPWAVTGSVGVTQLGAWAVTAAQGGTWVVSVPSTTVFQGTSPWIISGAVTLPVTSVAGTSTRSWAGGDLFRISLEQGAINLSGADGVILDADDPLLGANVTSLAAGNALKVDMVAGNVTIESATISIPPFPTSTTAYQGTTPWITHVTSTHGTVTIAGNVGQSGAPWSFTGSVGASQLGAWTVTANQGSNPWTVDGTVNATQSGAWSVGQAGAPWAVHVTSTHGTTTIGGTVTANQGGAWTVGVLSGAILAPITGTVTANQGGTWNVGQTGAPWSFTGSVGASQLGAWTVTANQGTSPWTVDGTVNAAQSGAWNVGQSGAPWTVHVTSTHGTVAVAGTVTANQGGAPWTVHVTSTFGTITIAGAVTQSGAWNVGQTGAPWSFTGSLVGPVVVHSTTVFQGTSPWVISGAVTQSGTWTVQQGTPPWQVTGSVGVTQLGTWNTNVTQVSSPWITKNVTVPMYEHHELTIPGSLNAMNFATSVFGTAGGTHATGSCSCARSAFAFFGTAARVVIRNVGTLPARFHFNAASGQQVTLDAGETLDWNFLATTALYVTTTSRASLRVLLVP